MEYVTKLKTKFKWKKYPET